MGTQLKRNLDSDFSDIKMERKLFEVILHENAFILRNKDTTLEAGYAF